MLVADFGHGFRYGIVVGEKQFIVTRSDFVHGVQSKLFPVVLPVAYEPDGEPDASGRKTLSTETVTQSFALDELLALAVETKLGVRDEEFGHYWGIKDRVHRNYGLLLNSMLEIGLSIDNMPKWGE